MHEEKKKALKLWKFTKAKTIQERYIFENGLNFEKQCWTVDVQDDILYHVIPNCFD